ncbi:MAG: hypothetical protein IKY30_04910 [Oscillospiraceae bacterium]|nr:hypothetical protein [Oscillospiraceae bacterium]
MKRKLQDYKDIIDMPRHISEGHPHMSIHDRAAQFAPFAALTGHSEAINETARIVASKIVLGEDAVQEISEKLNYIQIYGQSHIHVSITYFVQDQKKKHGGQYVTKQSIVKKLDDVNQTVLLIDGTEIEYDNILEIKTE